MIHDIDLRELSEYEGPERAFLSVYIGGRAGAQSVEHRLDAVQALLEDADEPEALEHFAQNAQLVRGWLEEHPADEGTTCVFACWALDLLRGYRLALELPTDVRVGIAPYVRPLAELQDEFETFAVVAADNTTTRVFLVTGKQNELAGQIRGDVKNHVRKGGWSQKRYQRRRDNELLHYSREVAEFLDELARDAAYGGIVLLGSQETTLAIEGELTPALAELVIAREALELDDDEQAMIAAAFEHRWDAERADERDLWKRIRDEYASGGLAAVGAADVLRAVTSGRAAEILVDRETDIPAMRCAACEQSTPGTPTSCPVCNGDTLHEVDVLNELTRQAQLTSAEIDFSDPIPGLTKVGGVAALLRY